MRRKLRIPILIFACLWYGLILPAHQRGALRLPEAGSEKTHDCCEPTPVVSESCHTPAKDGKPAKSDPVSHCAVCQLVSVTAPPPVIYFDLPTLGLLGSFDLPPIQFVLCHAPLDPHSGRDPPDRA